MTTITVQDLLQSASESGFEELVLVEPATYDLELQANHKAGADSVFIKGRIVSGGPYQGKLISCGSLTFNERATGIAVQNLGGMGIGKDVLNTLAAQFGGALEPFLDAVADYVKGRQVRAEIIHNEFPKNSGQFRTQFAIGKIQLLAAPAPPSVGGVPAAVAPPVAAPAPVPQTPTPAVVQPAVPAPAPAPAPAVIPAPVAPVPSVPGEIAVDDPGF